MTNILAALREEHQALLLPAAVTAVAAQSKNEFFAKTANPPAGRIVIMTMGPRAETGLTGLAHRLG